MVGSMRFGIVLLTDQPWSEAAQKWRAAEEMGFDHAWTYDPLVWGGLPDSPWRGALPTLAAAAGVTSTIGLGTLVSAPNLHHPYRLFRDAQALEDVSGGRFRLAVGTGGDRDSRVLGAEDLSVRDRVERFFELVEVLERLRSGDHVTHEGRWFSTDDARTLPGASFPLVVAGNGPRSVRFAARHGDAWVTTGPGAAETLDDWFAGLEKAPSLKVRPPRVAASPVNMECIVERIIRFGDGPSEVPTHVTFGRVVGVHIHESYLDADGYFLTAKAQPVARLGGIQYAISAPPFELVRQYTRAAEESYGGG